jgi:hypothetical protein
MTGGKQSILLIFAERAIFFEKRAGLGMIFALSLSLSLSHKFVLFTFPVILPASHQLPLCFKKIYPNSVPAGDVCPKPVFLRLYGRLKQRPA